MNSTFQKNNNARSYLKAYFPHKFALTAAGEKMKLNMCLEQDWTQ